MDTTLSLTKEARMYNGAKTASSLQVDSLPSELPRKTLVYPYYMLNLAIKRNAVLIHYNMDEL